MAERLLKLSRDYVRRSRGPLSRLRPGTRLAYVFLVSVSSMVFGRIEVLVALATASIVFFLLSGPSLRKLLSVSLLAAAVVWSIVLAQALFYQGSPRTPIAVLVPSTTPIIGRFTGGIYIYYEGLGYGFRQSLRALAGLYAGAGLASSTSIMDIYALLARHPRLLAALLAGLRGLEKLLDELEEGLASLKLTGARLGFSRLHKLIPLIVRRIEAGATSTALALEYSSPVRVAEGWGIVALMLFGLASLLMVLYVLYLLYSAGVLYSPFLQELYEWLRLWFS
ncbi:hypothetical protein CF15_07655 [Pyrodictium occultum]|uniref:Uncharacterized protein n=1 Tax=Pyrodictium occultum TaxID=2309 RepID=A0A0V8RX00_PYROC|nr:energy-coupling factor transporter transmembrane component T [Pyrodictium occultum]KSW12581.1 hypothetical protein CF15_07655 [Pyrodictium occultum]